MGAANEVTRRGRETLELMCRELAQRGVTLLEADTDGVYFAVPEGWTEADERRVVAGAAASSLGYRLREPDVANFSDSTLADLTTRCIDGETSRRAARYTAAGKDEMLVRAAAC